MKRSIAIALAVLMIFSMLPIASAEAMTDCEYKHTPADLHRVCNIALSMGAQEFVVCATPHIPVVKADKPYVAGREYAINRSNPRWLEMKPVWLQAAQRLRERSKRSFMVWRAWSRPPRFITNT